MNFLRLRDYLISVLFQNEEIIALDKPYGFNSHTNDSKVGNEDFIHEGLIEIFEKQLGCKLYIVHRLDQTTTGVIIFAKSPEAAKKYAAYFFDRQVRKTYLFVTSSQSKETAFQIDKVIVHKAKDLQAKTDFQLIKKTSSFQLWEAHPLTGRNHQIRIHAQAANISLLGDEKYGGAAFPFLCLHNRRIEFPNGVIVESVPPRYFDDLNLLENKTLAIALFETDRRRRLFAQDEQTPQCFRWAHNKDLGFTIDQLGPQLLLSYYDRSWSDSEQKTFSQYAKIMNKPMVVRSKDKVGTTNPVLSTEAADVWVAQENEIRYELRLEAGTACGLFIDQRLQRDWVGKNSAGKSILNLFSYTGSFSVAAAMGGALQVTSVDTNKNHLAWSKKNFELNQQKIDNHKFFCRDSVEFLDQCIKKNLKYDLIICDPPAFFRREKGVFKIETHLEDLLKKCFQCLTEDGNLLFSTSFEGFFIDDLRRMIANIKNGIEINFIQPSLDFELVGQKPILKSFLIRMKPQMVMASPSTQIEFESDEY